MLTQRHWALAAVYRRSRPGGKSIRRSNLFLAAKYLLNFPLICELFSNILGENYSPHSRVYARIGAHACMQKFILELDPKVLGDIRAGVMIKMSHPECQGE